MKLLLKGGALLILGTYLREAYGKEVNTTSTNFTKEPHNYGYDEKDSDMKINVGNYSDEHAFTTSLTKLETNIEKMNKELNQLDLEPKLLKTYFIGPTGSGKSTLINYLMET